ncbi:MAG: Leukotoxin, partial [Verrucomicrobiales bacterium VVV1]
TLSNFTATGKVYTATFTPTAGSIANGTVSVASQVFSDAQGNINADGAEANNTVTMTVDTQRPTIAISANKNQLGPNETATVTFSLSEASSDFTESDINVTGGTLSNFQGSGKTYTATFTPVLGSLANGEISVASEKFSDTAGNFNFDGADPDNTVTFAYDNTPPTIAITSDKTKLKAGDTASITFTLSESSTDFVQSDINVTGGTLSGFTGSGQVYTATFTPTAGTAGNGTVSVASAKFSDAAGNFNADGSEANNSVSMSSDTVVPTIAITSNKTSLKSGDTASLTFQLSKASSDFALGDITVNGGTLSNFSGSGTLYTATFTPIAGFSGNATVNVASSAFSDAAGNFNADGSETNNTVTMTTDTTLPTVAISASKTSLKAGDTSTITFTLSEASTDFTSGDVSVTGGTLSNFTGSGKDYTATFTPTAGTITFRKIS